MIYVITYLFIILAAINIPLSNCAVGPFSRLPNELVIQIVLNQIDPHCTSIKQKGFDTVEELYYQCRDMIPHYRLLLTCKSFYDNQSIKNRLHVVISAFPPLAKNILVLSNLVKKSHNDESLKLTQHFNIDGRWDCYINDSEIDAEHGSFFRNHAIIFTDNCHANKKPFSVAEFVIRNMSRSFRMRSDINPDNLTRFFKNHLSIIEELCLHSDVSLPTLHDPKKNIAQFLLDTLIARKDYRLTLTGGDHNCGYIQWSTNDLNMNPTNPNYAQTYQNRYPADELPNDILVDLTLFLSDEAFKQLYLIAKSDKKSENYNSLLNTSTLPILPIEQPIVQSPSFFKRICIIFKSLIIKIFSLITMIKNCFGYHI